MNLIDKMVNCLGGNAHAASLKLGVAHPTIAYWRKKGFIPVRYAALIAEKTGGIITESEIRHLAAKVSCGIC